MTCGQVTLFLASTQIDLEHYSYDDIFCNPSIDMLRPFGQNKYLGIVDDDVEEPGVIML
jgi:hypothetical protein